MAIRSLFISYAYEDRRTAAQLRDDLRDVGIHVWFGERDLAPGAPNWQDAVRRAIGMDTDALVLVASPDAARSPYVALEMELARTAYPSGRVFAFWVGGAAFARCVPLAWSSAQCIDARDRRYPEGLNQLLVALGVLTPGQPVNEQSRTILVLRRERSRQLQAAKDDFRDRTRDIFADARATRVQKAGALFAAWTQYEKQRSDVDRRWGRVLAEDGAPSMRTQFDDFLGKLEQLTRDRERALIAKLPDLYRLIEPYLHKLSELDKWWSAGTKDHDPPGTVDADPR